MEGDRHDIHPAARRERAGLQTRSDRWSMGVGFAQRQRGERPRIALLVRGPARVADGPQRQSVRWGQIAGAVAVLGADDPEQFAGARCGHGRRRPASPRWTAPSGGRTTMPRSRTGGGRRHRRASVASVTRRTRLATSPSLRFGRRQNAAKSCSPISASHARTMTGSVQRFIDVPRRIGGERIGCRAVVDQVAVAASGGREPGVERRVDDLGATPDGDRGRTELVERAGAARRDRRRRPAHRTCTTWARA